MRYWSHVPSGDHVCPLPPAMGYGALIDIGPLPLGFHRFTVTGQHDGEEFDRYETNFLLVRVREQPNADISGVRFAPEQSGRGLFVARLVGPQGRLTGFWWANHDAEGRPGWVVMTVNNSLGNDFEGEAITTHGPPLAPGPASIERERWGELSFAYRGCGRAQMAWSADDEPIGDGSVDLVQLALPEGISPCDISLRLQGPPAIWDEPLGE